MSGHIQVTIQTENEAQQQVIIAMLTGIGYEGFEESENLLHAFIPENNFDRSALEELASEYNFAWSSAIINEQNWNAAWESSFDPVIVEDFAGIRADFHPPLTGVEHEIVITPKMSFGTGHHATTYMMVLQMRDLVVKDKEVFDFGTGTGILAILAEKMEARGIIAIDNDQWSINNALENIEKNNCGKIELRLLSTPLLPQKFDIILANINKNIILENLGILAAQLNNQGYLLLSGLLYEDENDILAASKGLSLRHQKTLQKDNWKSILFSS